MVLRHLCHPSPSPPSTTFTSRKSISQLVRKTASPGHYASFKRVPRQIADTRRDGERGQHRKPERRNQQQRKLLDRPSENVHPVGCIATIGKSGHQFRLAEA